MTHDPDDPATMTPEMAAQIRTWRVDEEYTYRAVAQAATDLWGSTWGSNQIYGTDLCITAAQMLGEDPNTDPWN
ncbi:hypothetical protein ACIBSV_37630 [Embleya sp. NPDC050154]|uniref:hypothetical protein n=1 Tax=unclassified Embleya TaxID=2699296 RepID=UPI0037B21E80